MTEATAVIAETGSGRVRGEISAGICVFKGIPYGASTAGQNRFMPPRKPQPWTGVLDALAYGPVAMQDRLETQMLSLPPEFARVLQGNMAYGAHPNSEDCLTLHVWTPALRDGHWRPVMVWCHGGGFGIGSGQADWHDGTNLARNEDVVVVHFNHRLNIFGYLYLADLGDERFAASSNAGMLDIVAVLEWVRDNIAEFGGDPNNVTIFGESGGGEKVTTLMAMPAARGLFQRAIVQSGSGVGGVTREDATGMAREVLAQLNLRPDQLSELQALPAEAILDAMERLAQAATARGEFRMEFQPVLDGRSLPHHPLDPAGMAVSADVPLLVGTTKDEARLMGAINPELFAIDETRLPGTIKSITGADEATVAGVIETYRAAWPGASPSDLTFAVMTDRMFRLAAITQAERKSALGHAPAYMYYFGWEAPGSRYRAGHGVEVPFTFDNIDLAPGLLHQAPPAMVHELSRNVSAAWAAFARTGQPAHAGLPAWEPYDVQERATMVLDYRSRLVYDPHPEARTALAPLLARD